MWKCSDCGSICKKDICEKCGLSREETLFDDIYTDDEVEEFIEPIELPDPEQKKKNAMLKAREELKREKRVAKLEKKLNKAKKTKDGESAEDEYAVPRKRKRLSASAVYVVIILLVVAVSATLMVAMNAGQKGEVESVKKENEELRAKISGLESELNNTKTDFEQANSEAEGMDTENSDLRSEKESLESDIQVLKEENDSLNEKIDSLNSEISELNTKLSSTQAEVSLLRGLKDKVKVLEFNGTYHTYGCSAISSSKYWIYDRDQVVNNSNYKKCSVCH